MRIDNNLLITADNRTEAGDMMSRLEAGDVIKAKVLEISPREAVLRLSDGTVIKAGTAEPLDVKPGQTISLLVTSRNENSFVLRTIKSTYRNIAADDGSLQKMLKAAGIKADNINMKLAAEFLKYGVTPTSENITEASDLMHGSKGLDIEKAVYLTVKNIGTGQVDKNIISSFLSGDLKLGMLFDILYKALNSDAIEAENQNTGTGQPVHDTLTDTGNSSAQSTGHPVSDGAESSASSGNNSSLLVVKLADNEAQSTSAADQKIPDTNNQSGAVSNHPSDQTFVSGAEAKSSVLPETANNADNEADIDVTTDTEPNTVPAEDNVITLISKKSDTEAKSALAAKNSTDGSTGHTNAPQTRPSVRNSLLDISDEINNISTKSADKKHDTENITGDTLERINASIEKLYVNINKHLSGDELESASLRNHFSELANKLELLIQSPAASKAVRAQASYVLNLAEDTVKLLDMFNSNNVLYFQIPVKIENYRSTAELYVMKRQKNKKRIDPNDTVLFLSLDTKNLGRVETILDIKGLNISISLRTENKAVSDFARENIKNLYSAISECGYKLADIKYSIIGEAATPAQQEKLLTGAVRLKHGRVDFRI